MIIDINFSHQTWSMSKSVKPLLLLLLISLITNGWTQKEGDYIIWGTKELEWIDFKGIPDRRSNFDAQTRSQMEAPNRWNQDSLHLEVLTKFITSKSWVKKIRTKELLKHEMLHFDITEYHTRLFRKAVLNYRFSSYKKVGDEVSALFHKYHSKAKIMQAKYDKASAHSKNKKGQVKWNKKVALLLQKTATYTMTKIDLYIGYMK
jgi:hypothetical protein